MTVTPNHLGLVSSDRTSARSSDRLGAVVRSRLAGAAVGIAVAAVTVFGAAPAYAGHKPSHDAKPDPENSLQIQVDELKAGLAAEEAARTAADTLLESNIDTIELTPGPDGPPGDDAFFDTTGCVAGDVITFTGSGLECVTPDFRRTVFITSAGFPGDLAFEGDGIDGLDGADNLCQEAADSDGAIVPPGEYVALLSTSFVDARDRLTPNTSGYVLPDGSTKIAANRDDLFDGAILNPINQDELGALTLRILVWTGSQVSGEFGGTELTDFETCLDWTSPSIEFLGAAGVSTLSDFNWIFNGNGHCHNPGRLYCFQQ